MSSTQAEAKGKDEEWVRIHSQDGYSFLVKRKVAIRSGTLKNMLSDDSFSEATSNTCEVSARALVTEKLMEYLSYKTTYENAGPKEDIPDFFERIMPEIALELLAVADYYET